MHSLLYWTIVVALIHIVIVSGRPSGGNPDLKVSAFSVRPLDTPDSDTLDTKIEVHRNAYRDRSHRWPGGVIPYVIKEEFPQPIHNTILKAMKEIEDDVRTRTRVCIEYVPRTSEKNYLEIRLGKGCTTEIGFYDKGPHYSTLGAACAVKGVIVHELLHSLGFYHEQNRYDRALAVNINTTNIIDRFERDFNIRNSSTLDILGTDYDMKSIMHYAPYTFSKVPQYPVITPKAEHTPNIQLGQRYGLSETDVIKIQRYYGCPEDTSHIRSDLSPENSVFRCTFENDSCGMTQDDGHALTWQYRSTPTNDGPIGGATTGVDPYMYVSSSFVAPNSSSVNNGAPTPSPGITASISTPLMDIPDDSTICIDFHVFHAGPSSFLQIYVSGPTIPRQSLYSYENAYVARWTTARIVSTLPEASQFRIEFLANIENGPLGIDDVYIIKGMCE